MKKLALVLAIALIAAFAAPVFAAEVTIGGVYHLVAVSEDPGYRNPDADKDQFFFQRFRVPVSWKINDNVSANLRLDFAEGGWGIGTTDSPWSRPIDSDVSNTTELQVDRAFVTLKNDFYTLNVGQQYSNVGNAILVDHNFFGFDLKLNFKPLTVGLQWAKNDENGSLQDSDAAEEDDDLYMVNLVYKVDAFNIGIAYAEANDNDLGASEKKQGIAVFGSTKIGTVTLTAEVDYFFGEFNSTVDYFGTNVLLDANMPINDMLKVGLSVVYAPGSDDADETQITSVQSAGAAFSVFDYGGALRLEGLGSTGYFDGGTTVFDLGGDSTGVQGAMIYLDATFSKTVQGYFRLGYAEPQEDDNTDLDSLTAVIANIDWTCIPNVTLSFGGAYVVPDWDLAGTNDDANVELVSQLRVTF